MNSKFRIRWRWEFALFGSILISVGVLLASEIGYSRVQASHDKIVRGMIASSKLSALMGLVADAETSQRGYFLTERATYLDTFSLVVPQINPLILELRDAYNDTPSMLSDFDHLVVTLRERLSEIELTLAMVKEGQKATAKELTLAGIGNEKMDLLRSEVRKLQMRERENTALWIDKRQLNIDLTRVTTALVTVLNIVLLALLFNRLRHDREEEERRQAQLDQLVAERTAQLEILASHLQQVSEAEKSRIARELHDQLGAILTASKMDMSWVRQHLAADQAVLGEKLSRALKNLDQGVQIKRSIIENLVPSTLRTFGLVVALRELAENMQASAGWVLDLELPEDDSTFSENASIALFRIAQESINNAAKYASAKTLRVALSCEDDFVMLEIRDDGAGFDLRNMRPKSHGLAGMRQRMIGLGGALQIDSRPGNGTRIRARLPRAVAAVAVPAAAEAASP